MKPVLSVVWIATLGAAVSAAGQDTSWKGKSVVYTKPHKEIEFGDVVGGKQVYFPFSGDLPITVSDDREGWIRIHDGHREGWVDKADFVLADEAPAYFHRRVQANPKDAFALYKRGLGCLCKGEYDNAIKDFGKCIRLHPTSSTLFNTRGTAWALRKDFAKAIADYTESIRLDPKNAMAYTNRAWLWASCPDAKYRDGKKAVQSAQEALRLAEVQHR
jgi:tetratricopeptide (TPR) repeat protein